MLSKKDTLISVIVPVYKVEPYLHCCIDSILAQTFSDFELVLVDDGSPDNCGVICDEYAAKDERVVVIHQENQGVSAARNAGLDWVFANSNSEWIIFVDSDDALVPTCLENLYQHTEEAGIDMVITYGHYFSDDTELKNASQHVVSSRKLTGRECCILLYSKEEIPTQPWGKLCRRRILENVRFRTELSFAEDEEVVVRLLYASDNVTILRSWLYCYRQRENSASYSLSLNFFQILRCVDLSIAHFMEHNEQEIIKLAEQRKIRWSVYLHIKALENNVWHMIPKEYKISLLKFICLFLKDTLSRDSLIKRKITNWLRKK